MLKTLNLENAGQYRVALPRLLRKSRLKVWYDVYAMKLCSKCGKTKDLSEFNRNKTKKDGRQVHCRACTGVYYKQYYVENKDRMIGQIYESKKKRVLEVRQYLAMKMYESGCVDCGIKDIRVLEFDHVSGEKVDGVARLAASGYSIEAIEEEISKCEVRCRNHHTIKTYERAGGSWHDSFLNELVH